MSSFKKRSFNRLEAERPRVPIQTRLGQSRVGRVTNVEYVNRAGQRVNPKTGKPLFTSTSKPFFRPTGRPFLQSTGNPFLQLTSQPFLRPTGKPFIRPTGKQFLQQSQGIQGKNKFKQLPVRLRGTMFQGLTPIETDPSIDPPSHVCFNCWQPGHSRRGCPRPPVAQMCNNCGRRGEDVMTCPRCSQAHKLYLAQLRSKERNGHVLTEVEIDQLLEMADFENDNLTDDDDMNEGGEEATNDDDLDEVLQEVIMRDQRERQLRAAKEREALEQQQKQEAQERERERRNKYEDRYYADKDRESARRNQPREQQQPSRYEDTRGRNFSGYLERNGTSNGVSDKRRQESPEALYKNGSASATSNSKSHTDDPVLEVMQLAKSISHLSPDTQDLIMRQVMAERMDRQKPAQDDDDSWP